MTGIAPDAWLDAGWRAIRTAEVLLEEHYEDRGGAQGRPQMSG